MKGYWGAQGISELSTKPGWEVRHPGVTPQAIHRRVTDRGSLWVPHYCRVQEPDAAVTSVLCSQNGASSDDWLLEQSLGQERDWLSLVTRPPRPALTGAVSLGQLHFSGGRWALPRPVQEGESIFKKKGYFPRRRGSGSPTL